MVDKIVDKALKVGKVVNYIMSQNTMYVTVEKCTNIDHYSAFFYFHIFLTIVRRFSGIP